MVGDPQNEIRNPEKLRSISVQVMEVSELLTETLGEITPEIEAFMIDLSRQLKGTTDLYAYLLRRLELEAEFHRKEAREQAQRAKSAETAIDRLKARIKDSMKTMNSKRIEGHRWGFTLKKGKEKVSLDEKAFPTIDKRPDLWRAKTEYLIDKGVVLRRLQGGEEIPGAKLEDVYALTPIDMVPTLDVSGKLPKGKDRDD